MSEWREQTGPSTSTSPIPKGSAKLPDPYHRKELYSACHDGEEVRVERETELTYRPAPPAAPKESVIKTTTRTIHTGRKCPEGQTGQNVAWPGGITFPYPLPPPPEPPGKDKYKKERDAAAEFEKRWGEASPNRPK